MPDSFSIERATVLCLLVAFLTFFPGPPALSAGGRRAAAQKVLHRVRLLPPAAQPRALVRALRADPGVRAAKARHRERALQLTAQAHASLITALNGTLRGQRTSVLRTGVQPYKTGKDAQRATSKIKPDLPMMPAGIGAESEPNGGAASANAITFGSYTKGEVTVEDEDWFTFTANQGDIIDLYAFAEEFNSELDGILTLYGGDGTTILTFNDDYEFRDPRIIYKIPANGTYYLQLISYNSSRVGSYELSFQRLGNEVETEPNNAIGNATALSGLSGAAWGTIGGKDDIDFYRLAVPGGAAVGVRLESILDDTSPDMILALYDASGNLVAMNDDHLGGKLFTAELAFTNRGPAATYFLQASVFDTQASGEYALSTHEIGKAGPGVSYAALGDSAGGRFLAFDLATGNASFVGYTRFHGASALTSDSNGELIAARSRQQNSPLFRIDPASGSGFGLFPMTGVNKLQALAFDGNDELFGIDSLNTLFRIHFDAQSAESLFTIEGPAVPLSGMAFDPIFGDLYAATGEIGNTAPDQIWKIDIAGKTAALLGTTKLGGPTTDLFFDATGQLFGAKGGDLTLNSLIHLDRNSGTAAVVGPLGFVAANGLSQYFPRVFDVGVEAVNAPQSGQRFSSREKIVITLKNFGNIYRSGFDVSFRVNGPATSVATENIGALIVPAGGAALYTFTATADLSRAGNYNIETSTNLPGDSNSANDLLNAAIQSLGAATAVEAPPAIPEEFALFQNYPNPFNPITTIAFDLPEARSVTITLYNAAGQLVRRLAQGFQSPGRHRIVWDGSDDAGEAVSSGLYVYEMRAGTFTARRKLMLLK